MHSLERLLEKWKPAIVSGFYTSSNGSTP
jgi:hypothetical protein